MLSEIKRGKKKLVKDPIKSIGVGAGNTAREIVIQIASALGLKVHSDGIGVSAYGGTTIRIADHRTYMQTWVDSGAWQSPYRFDVVIEDDETVARTQVKDGYDFTITEFISKSCEMTPQIARMIAYDIRNTIDTGNGYANNVRAFKTTLISTHGAEGSSDNANNDNNDIKTENYMRNNKRTIRLTESDLHRVIKESVKRILKEAAYNGNHVGRDNGNGRFEMTHPEGKYSLYFDKAQRDAHNYNAQQQGQIPNPYAGWSKRVNDGNGNWSDAEFNGEDMHMYKDDDATTTAQNLRQYDPNGAYHWDMFRGHGDQYRQS